PTCRARRVRRARVRARVRADRDRAAPAAHRADRAATNAERLVTARVYLAGAVRTPIGNFGGALARSSAAHRGGVAATAAIERSKVPREAVEEVLVGHARQAGNGPNLARQVVRRAGLADAVPAFTINKACASGMQAVVSAAQSVRLGDAD